MAKKSLSILVVDDEIEFIGFLLDKLKGCGYSVVAVDNGQKAISLAKQNFYDLFLIDINMPGIDGIEVFEKVREISTLSSVIMMTAGAPESKIESAIKKGAYAVVYKPYLKKIVSIIDEAMAKARVLIVDDDANDKETLKNMLMEKKYKIITASSKKTALTILSENKIDVAFIGTVVCGEDGFTILKQIKQNYPKVGCIMMAADVDIECSEIALKNGAYTTVHKPLNVEMLVGIIEKMRREKASLLEDFKSVLLVEDNPSISTSLKKILQLEGYKVCDVATGADAINESKKALYSSAVVDFKLPDMTGIDVIKKIRDVNPDIVVIVITGYEEIDIAISALKEHVFDFFVKPVASSELIESLRRGLEV